MTALAKTSAALTQSGASLLDNPLAWGLFPTKGRSPLSCLGRGVAKRWGPGRMDGQVGGQASRISLWASSQRRAAGCCWS